MKKGIAIAVGGLMAFAFIAGAIVLPRDSVSALELARQSYAKVAELTPEQKKKLEGRVQGDSQTQLKEAERAADLKSYTYDEYLAAHPQALPAQLPAGVDLKEAKFLTFTDSNGYKNVMAIGKNGLPVYVNVTVELEHMGGTSFSGSSDNKAGVMKQGVPQAGMTAQ
jgi:hypothetical protein